MQKKLSKKSNALAKAIFRNFFTFSFLGELCETIPPLLHGNTTCVSPIKETTDTTCSFFCQKGFEIHGSTSRTCKANHKWNGTITKCESKLLLSK